MWRCYILAAISFALLCGVLARGDTPPPAPVEERKPKKPPPPPQPLPPAPNKGPRPGSTREAAR